MNAAKVLTANFQNEDSEFDELTDSTSSEDEMEDKVNTFEDISDAIGNYNKASMNLNDIILQGTKTKPANPQVVAFKWEYYEDFDPFESNWVTDYNCRRGILVDTTDFKPLDCFFFILMKYST